MSHELFYIKTDTSGLCFKSIKKPKNYRSFELHLQLDTQCLQIQLNRYEEGEFLTN